MKTFLILIVFSAALQAQIFGPPTQFKKVTVATLPSGVSAGYTTQITDGANVGDCATGGGSTRVWCTYNGSSWQAMSGTGGATGPTGPTGGTGPAGATGATGATGAGLTNCSETASQITCPGGFAAGATGAGSVGLKEASANGTDSITLQAPDSVTTAQTLKFPAAANAANETLKFGAPSSAISQATWARPLWLSGTNANGYFDWTLGSAPGNPASGDIRLYPKTGSTLCAKDSGGTETCYGSGGGSSTKTYTFQGGNQGDTPAWNLQWRSLNNITFSTLDATHIRPLIIVTANTTASAMWSVTPVTTTNPTVSFIAKVRSTDATNAGSIALSYACVPGGDSVDNPTPTGLTALSLTTIDPDSEIFQSSQAVTCTGTESAPADLYVWWTPTAPSGGTLSLIKLMLVY